MGTSFSGQMLILDDKSPGVNWKVHEPGTVYSCEVHVAAKDGRFTAVVARKSDLTVEGATAVEATEAMRPILANWLKAQKSSGGVNWDTTKRQPHAGELVRVLTVEIV